MGIVAFDTLRFVEKLEAAGVERAHAKATAEAEGFVTTELADKSDIATVRAELAAVKTELKNDIALLEQRMVVKLGGILVIMTGVLLAAFRYLGH